MDTLLISLAKLFKCINTSKTVEHLETTRKMMNNFFKLYDVDYINELYIKEKFNRKYEELQQDIF